MNSLTLTGRTKTLSGYATKDIDVRYTPNGVAYATFTLEVRSNFENANGKYDTDFINCVAWGKQVEILIDDDVKKGNIVSVTGRLKTRNYVTEVLVDTVNYIIYI